jgi:hypothetical protein
MIRWVTGNIRKHRKMRAEFVGEWSQTEKEEPAIKRGKGGT